MQSPTNHVEQTEMNILNYYKLIDKSLTHSHANQPLQAIQILVSLLHLVCKYTTHIAKQAHATQVCFWDRLNMTWFQVLDHADSVVDAEWRMVIQAIESCGNVLELYGLVDYPIGLQEDLILARIKMLLSPRED